MGKNTSLGREGGERGIPNTMGLQTWLSTLSWAPYFGNAFIHPGAFYSIPRIACVGSFSLHEIGFGLTTCKEYLLERRYNTFMECF
jgi:hypothetical protein